MMASLRAARLFLLPIAYSLISPAIHSPFPISHSPFNISLLPLQFLFLFLFPDNPIP